jgi:hypothetical protein
MNLVPLRGNVPTTAVAIPDKQSQRLAGASVPPSASQRLLHRMWLSLLRRDWRSLVVVPADPSVSPKAFTESLADLARTYDVGPVQVKDASGATLAWAETIAADLPPPADAGTRVVIGVDFPLDDPSALPILAKAGAAVVVIRYRSTDVASARVIVDLIGRERVLGCVAVDGDGTARPSGADS